MKKCQLEGCNNNVFSHNYCVYHQNKRTDDKYIISQEKRKEKQKWTKDFNSLKLKPKEATGEKEIFEEIWQYRNHISWLTASSLKQYEDFLDDEQCWKKHPLWVNLFHHVLNKKNYSKFRLIKDNIILLTPQEHLDIHSLSSDKLIEKYGKINMDRYNDRIETLKKRYKNE